jgi:hypothetical protein
VAPQEPHWYRDESPIGTGEDLEGVVFDAGSSTTLKAECGYNDPGKTVYIEVIVPEPDQVSFVGYNPGEEHDIDSVTDPVWKRVSNPDDPASYTKGRYVKVEAKFWASDDLTYSTDVYVDVFAPACDEYWADSVVTFGSWPSETTTHRSENRLPTSIGSWNFTTYVWSYKVPSGTDQWIGMGNSGPHKIYRVYDAPKCSSGDYTKDHLEHACDWGDGGVEVTENDIPKKIQYNCWWRFDFIHLADPWDLETTDGDCVNHAELVAEALKVLGINADGSTASSCRVRDMRYCVTHGVWEHHYFQPVGCGFSTNFEAVCEVNLIDEATPWNCYYDKALDRVGGDPAYQKGSHANMWTEWNNNPPPNHKVIHHFTGWEGH